MTLDPNESDALVLWTEIARLNAATKGPDGYTSWQDAATAERVRRVRALDALSHIANPLEWEQAHVREGYVLNYPMLMQMLNDPEYYKRVAREALDEEPAERSQVDRTVWSLDESEAALLRDTIGHDGDCPPITLALCTSPDGYGLHVWLTDDPEEGSVLLQRAAEIPR